MTKPLLYLFILILGTNINSKNVKGTRKLEMKYLIFTKKLNNSFAVTSAMLSFEMDIIKHPIKMYQCAERFLLSDVYFKGNFKENLDNNKDSFLAEKKDLALLLAKINNSLYRVSPTS